MLLLRRALCAFALLLLVFPAARAATLNVPTSQYPTIQSGINAAASGDTVLVADGTYTGPGNVDLDFAGKDITVASVNGAASTIIDCQGSSSNLHRGFLFRSGETSAAIINGLTVKNGNPPVSPNDGYDGGGVELLNSSNPTIINCIFTANQNAIGSYGGGATIIHCTFISNQGTGINDSNDSPMIITDCSFINNQGNGMVVDGAVATITNCTFVGNQDNGLYSTYANPTVTNCTFTNNQANAVDLYTSDATLTNCILWNDISEIALQEDSAITLSYCDVQGGYAGPFVINADPLFLRAPNITAVPPDYGDLHLQASSPCTGAGTESIARYDKDGRLRSLLPSLGAYEGKVRFDFDGDNHSDLLWHNTRTGQTLVWNLSDQTVTHYGSAFATVSNTDWTVAAVADVNGDAHPDLLWQNRATGQVLFWLMGGSDGTQVLSYGSPFATVPDTNWHIVSMADFDGDGHPDILWQNSATNQLCVWYMNGTSVIKYGSPFAQVTDTAWQVVGTADFNQDGHPDLLWENSQTGGLVVWNLSGADGLSVLGYGGVFATVANTSWHVVGTGDMNGDGHADLVWQNTQTGDVLRWLMGGADGTTVQSYDSPFATVTDTHWQIVGVH